MQHASFNSRPGSPAMQLLLMCVNKLSMASSKTFLGRLALQVHYQIFHEKKPPPSQHPSTNQHQLSHSPHSFHRRKIWYTWLSDYQWLAANEALVGFHGFTPARFDKAMKVGHSCHSLVLEDRHVVTCVNGTGTWRHRQSVSGFKWCPGWFVDFWVKNLQHRFKYNLISMMNMIRCDIMWYINVYSNVYIMYRIQNDMTTHNNQVLIRIPCHSHMYIEYIQI